MIKKAHSFSVKWNLVFSSQSRDFPGKNFLLWHSNFYKIKRIRIKLANKACRLEKNKMIISIAFLPIPLLKITVMPVQIAQVVNIKPVSTRNIYICACRAKKSEVKIKMNIIKVVEIPNKNDP